jgi:hypothetical protein
MCFDAPRYYNLINRQAGCSLNLPSQSRPAFLLNSNQGAQSRSSDQFYQREVVPIVGTALARWSLILTCEYEYRCEQLFSRRPMSRQALWMIGLGCLLMAAIFVYLGYHFGWKI